MSSGKNISPFGGVGAQFFDNNGNPLTGGLIYTYESGTTTPKATYTNEAGTTAHSNPIVLDAAGRVPGGEIWLDTDDGYKFVIKTADDVIIATLDGIVNRLHGVMLVDPILNGDTLFQGNVAIQGTLGVNGVNGVVAFDGNTEVENLYVKNSYLGQEGGNTVVQGPAYLQNVEEMKITGDATIDLPGFPEADVKELLPVMKGVINSDGTVYDGMNILSVANPNPGEYIITPVSGLNVIHRVIIASPESHSKSIAPQTGSLINNTIYVRLMEVNLDGDPVKVNHGFSFVVF